MNEQEPVEKISSGPWGYKLDPKSEGFHCSYLLTSTEDIFDKVPAVLARFFHQSIWTGSIAGIGLENVRAPGNVLANVRLAAAAPPMLRALELISEMSPVLPDDKYFREFVVSLSKNAVFKATGETL